jgi:hypothetical protein
VSAVASILEVPEPAVSPAASFTRAGRLAAAATLVLGAACQVAVFAIEPQHSHTVDRLRWIADHPDRANVAKLFDVLAMPFLLGGVLVYVLLSRRRSPRLAYAGGILLGCGMVGLSMAQGFETLEFSLAQDGRFDLAALADRIDDTTSAPAIAMLLLFIPGAFLGVLTVAAALWRSRAVPRGAVVLLPVFIVVDVVLQQGLPAHVIALVGASWIALAVLRTTPAEPDRTAEGSA